MRNEGDRLKAAELAARRSPEGQDTFRRARPLRRMGNLLPVLAALWLVCAIGSATAQDTPEMLAAMRAALPPVPEQVPDIASLPPELRRQIPLFRIQGHRWHADPALRFAQINGRRVAEDGVAGQELWLRQIRIHSVVMQFRDGFFVQTLTRGD